MAYNPTTWVNGTTKVNESNMNKIEQGIYDNSLQSIKINQEAVTFTESDLIIVHNNTEVVNETIRLINESNTSWDLENATYDSVSKSVGSEDASPTGISFKSDGTKMYVISKGNDAVYQYSLSTAWDLSTATYDSVSKSVGSEDTIPTGIFFKSDGTKMYIVGDANDTIYQYSLSTAWDLSTATYDSVSKSVGSEDAEITGVSFKSDGTKMYVSGDTNDTVFQYSLSTAWDLSTATYDSVSKNVSGEIAGLADVIFKPDGTKMYALDTAPDAVHQYSLSTAWDLSTATYDSISYSVSQDSTVQGIFIDDNGKKMYIIGTASDSAYQYSVGETIPAETSGDVTVQFDDAKLIYLWDIESYQRTLDGETVTVDVQLLDGTWTAVKTNVERNEDISDLGSNSKIRFKVNISRVDTTNNPSIDYLAFRYGR